MGVFSPSDGNMHTPIQVIAKEGIILILGENTLQCGQKTIIV
jgi:hypothetical protein